jgi:N-hydroxyarylamine O-acetyltransferase
MTIVATIDGQQWLCDLGFGSYGIREPVNLNWIGRELQQGFDMFKLLRNLEHNYLQQKFPLRCQP